MSSSLLNWLSNPIGSAVSAIGGIISNQQNAKENQKNREWSEKMWNLNNEYNSPSAVLQRYSDAGIQVNPNYLLTGSYNGGLSSYAGNADTSRSMENPVKGFNVGFLEAQGMRNQTRQTDSTIKTNESQQRKNDADATKAAAEATVAEKTAQYKETENKYQESNIILDLAKKGLEKSALELTVQFTKEANPLQIGILKEQLLKAAADKQVSQKTVDLLTEQIKTQEATTGLVLEEQNTEKSKQAANYASAEQSKAAAVASRAQAKLFGSQSNYYAALAKTENDLRPAQKEKLESEIFKTYRELRKIDSEVFKNETDAKMLIFNGILAYGRLELDKYIAMVRDNLGTNAATIVNNSVRQLCQGDFPIWTVKDGKIVRVNDNSKVTTRGYKWNTHMKRIIFK